MVKKVEIRRNQLWELPIPSWYQNGMIINDRGLTAFYLVKEKNSNQMWRLERVWPLNIEKDHNHNKFVHRDLIVRSGSLIGRNVNLDTVKLLYSKKVESQPSHYNRSRNPSGPVGVFPRGILSKIFLKIGNVLKSIGL